MSMGLATVCNIMLLLGVMTEVPDRLTWQTLRGQATFIQLF